MAKKNSESYYRPSMNFSVSTSATTEHPSSKKARDNCCTQEKASTQVAAVNVKCFLCGLARHPRSKCLAKNSVCNNCGKTGHYARVCKSVAQTAGLKQTSAAMPSMVAVTASSGVILKQL